MKHEGPQRTKIIAAAKSNKANRTKARRGTVRGGKGRQDILSKQTRGGEHEKTSGTVTDEGHQADGSKRAAAKRLQHSCLYVADCAPRATPVVLRAAVAACVRMCPVLVGNAGDARRRYVRSAEHPPGLEQRTAIEGQAGSSTESGRCSGAVEGNTGSVGGR